MLLEKKHYSMILFLCLTALSMAAGEQCLQDSQNYHIQTGIIEFENSHQRQNCRDVSVNLGLPESPIQSVASVVGIQTRQFGSFIEYFVKSSQHRNKRDSVTVTLIVNEAMRWTAMTVSYFATSREDLLLGSYLVDATQTLPCQAKDNQETVEIASQGVIPNWNGVGSDFASGGQNLTVITLLSGIKSNRQSVELIELSNSRLNSSGFVHCDIKLYSQLDMELIQVSFIVVGRHFPFQYGFTYDNSPDSLTIVTEVSNNQMVAYQWAIESQEPTLKCQGSLCPSECIERELCLELKGTLSASEKECIICEEGSTWNGHSCRPRCSQSQIWNGYACKCKQSFISIGDNCYECPANSSPDSTQADCICNEGHIWSDWKASCVSYHCPVNSVPRVVENGVDCQCKSGFYKKGDVCKTIPHCPSAAQFDIHQGKCLCVEAGFVMSDKGRCEREEVDCPAHSEWNSYSKKCECHQENGYVQLAGKCTFICGQNQLWKAEQRECVCVERSIKYNGVCVVCPPNSHPDGETCTCNLGFVWDDSTSQCEEERCPENSKQSYISGQKECICIEGFLMKHGRCARVSQCPSNSKWNDKQLCCECVDPKQFIIDNVCQGCPDGEQWDKSSVSCVCQQGTNRINGKCSICEINQSYNGSSCECNLGFFVSDSYGSPACEKCHKSCGSCSGPRYDQCLTCSDVTYTLTSDNTCVKEGKCPRGLYLKGASCQPCSTYCAECSSESVCDTCIDGFEMESISYGDISATFCVETCGDGRRFELDCDDGNNRNGDGCSSDCKVESGYTCTGGSSVKASTCMRGTPDRTFLETTGSVHLYGRIVQGVRLSYLPESLTANDCAECYNLLWVRVIRSDIVPGIRVNYLPKSKYQFLVEFEFHGTFSIPVFTVAIQLNPEYSKYFNRRDMAQIQIKTIDPATLAIHDKEETLELSDFYAANQAGSQSDIEITSSLVEEIFED